MPIDADDAPNNIYLVTQTHNLLKTYFKKPMSADYNMFTAQFLQFSYIYCKYQNHMWEVLNKQHRYLYLYTLLFM